MIADCVRACGLRLPVALAAILASLGVAAKDYRVSEVQTFGEVKCYSHYSGWLTTTTGPCSDFKPSSSLRLGETFSERGINHVIKVIVATQVEADYDDGKWSIKKGE